MCRNEIPEHYNKLLTSNSTVFIIIFIIIIIIFFVAETVSRKFREYRSQWN